MCSFILVYGGISSFNFFLIFNVIEFLINNTTYPFWLYNVPPEIIGIFSLEKTYFLIKNC